MSLNDRARQSGATATTSETDPAGNQLPADCEQIAACLAGPAVAERPGLPLDRSALRDAAVLVPLVQRPEGLHVILTRRSEDLASHAGQISFPGGRIDPGDASPLHAALREADEEISLAPSRVRLLGAMPHYPTATGFMIHPFVGYIRDSGILVPQPSEVAEIFEVPLAFFLDPANHRPHHIEYQGQQYRLHAMPYGDYYIWGATAAILRELYARVRGHAPEMLPEHARP